MKKIAIVVLFILLASAMQAGALAQRTVDEKELMASQWGIIGEKFGWGDRLYKITYTDRTFEYKLERGSGLSKASMIDLPMGVVVTSKDGTTNIPLNFVGLTCGLYGSSKPTNNHMIYFYNKDKSVFFASSEVTVPCAATGTSLYTAERAWVNFVIPNSMFGNMLNTNAAQELYLMERIHYLPDNGGDFWIDGQTSWINFRSDISTTSSTPTPTPTATLKSGQCRDSYGNIYSCGTPTPTPTATTNPAKYYVKVTSNVHGNVYIDGTSMGTTGGTFTLSDGGGHDVEVRASGYNTFKTRISVDYGTTATVDATLTEIATGGSSGGSTGGSGTSSNGYIKVTSNIPANVEIDNKHAGTTEQSFFTATVGEHEVKVSQGGYTTFITQVTVKSGATTEVTALIRQTATATSTATSTPTGTSTIQQEGGLQVSYKGVDITIGADGKYYVGDMKHATIAEARATIDELMASKEPKSPGFEAVFAIAGLFAVAYIVLRQKPKER